MTCGFAARAVLIGALVCGCKGGGEGTGSGGADAGAGGGGPPIPGIGWTTRLLGPRGSPAGLAWNGERLVTVGESIQSSSDGLRWEEQMALIRLNDVAWNGRTFMAVGPATWTFTSMTGLQWNRNPAAGAELQALASSGALWVAVGRAGAARTSVDGTTWTTVATPTTKDLRALAWSGSQFVAGGPEGLIMTSPDGASWTMRTSGTTDDITAVGASSSLMVATTFPSNSSPSAVLTSPDGVTWTVRARGLPSANHIIQAAGRWVLVGDYRVVTSSDGVNFEVSASNVGMLESIVHTGRELVAIGATGSSVPAVYSSPDGREWTMRSSAQRFTAVARASTDGRLVAVAQSEVSLASTDGGTSWRFGALTDGTGALFLDVEWSPALNRFVALAQEGANERIYTSEDGLAWSRGVDPPFHGALGASPTLLVDVGASLGGRGLATSPDGATWTTHAVPTTQRLEDVFWTGTQFIAVGNGGTIVTSPDGGVWTLRTSGTTAALHGAAASPALTVVVGDDGTILTSRDGATWGPRPSMGHAALRRVVWTGDAFVAVGSGGTALRSTDGASWTVHATPYTKPLFGSDPFDLNDAVWTGPGGRLVVVGTRGLVATSP